MITAAQTLWNSYANETISVEEIGGALYCFCSELAALRIAIKYPKQLADGTAKAAYSEGRESWYFRLETN